MNHRKRAVLGLQKRKYHQVLGRAQAVCNGLEENPGLFGGYTALPLLKKKIQGFADAIQAAATHALGTTEARADAAASLITTLESARAFVQELADNTPAQAGTIITSAGMMVGEVTSYSKPFLQARASKTPGAAEIIANVGVLTADTTGNVFFNWQYSGDAGRTWISLPSTPRGSTEVTGLTALVTYSFRVSVTDSKGTGAWSDAVTLLAL